MADNPPATGLPVIGMISMMSPDPSRLAALWSGLMGLPIADGNRVVLTGN
ncbi:hypothetical protein [Rothia koreensis]